MKLMIMGYKRHGKDTMCEYLRDKYGITFASSSEFACELFLFDKIKDQFGYKTPKEAFDDRGNHRQLWYEEIKAFNVEHGLDALGKLIYENNDAYCGIRDDEEFYALKEAKAFELAVWVDASKRLPPEEGASNKLSKEDADVIIDNNGTEKELFQALDRFYHRVIAPSIESEEESSMSF